MNNYEEYIQGWIWQDKKEIYLKARKDNGWPIECLICQGKYGLQLHHLHYNSLGNERQDDLILVCMKCHQDIHNDKCKKPQYNFSKTKHTIPE